MRKIIDWLSLKYWFEYLKRIKYLKQFKKNNLQLAAGCRIINSRLGRDNYLGSNVALINSTLGDHSYVNSNSTIRNAVIGKFCSIGPNVQIVLGTHPVDLVSTHPAFYSDNKPFATFSEGMYFEEYKSAEIGNDVWIGEGALIPGGVKIGNGAVVTARAVVTKDVEPYSIVGGIPARHIRYRFDEHVIREIQSSCWWDWEPEKLRETASMFRNTEAFVNHANGEP